MSAARSLSTDGAKAESFDEGIRTCARHLEQGNCRMTSTPRTFRLVKQRRFVHVLFLAKPRNTCFLLHPRKSGLRHSFPLERQPRSTRRHPTRGLPGVRHVREDSSTGYGLRFSTEIYGRKRFSNEDIQETCFVLTEISGNLREFTGECNLGILYSSSLLVMTHRCGRSVLRALRGVRSSCRTCCATHLGF